jgi:hypothetical protein
MRLGIFPVAVLALLAIPAGASSSSYVHVSNPIGPPGTLLSPEVAAGDVSNQLSLNPGLKVWNSASGGMDQPLCPQVELFNGEARCVVEWRDGARTWWFALATVSEHQARNNIYEEGNKVPEGGEPNNEATIWSLHHWTRRWTSCSLRYGPEKAPGKLSSNNDCGRGWPQSDVYFVAVQMWPDIRDHLAVKAIGWSFTDSAGYELIGDLHVTRNGQTWTATNALGDSFRYTP